MKIISILIINAYLANHVLAKQAVDAYSDHYKEQGEGSTQAYVRAEKIDDFLKAVNEFAYALSQSGEKQVVKDAINQAQSYAISENKDLYHFAQLVVAKTQNADVKAKGQALMTFIKDKLVAHNRTNNSEGGWWGPVSYENSHGVAIYMPSSGLGAGYDELAWAKYSNWDEFIKWYQENDKENKLTSNEKSSSVKIGDLLNGLPVSDKISFMNSIRIYNGRVASQSYYELEKNKMKTSEIDKILSVFGYNEEKSIEQKPIKEVSMVDFSELFYGIPEKNLSNFYDSIVMVDGYFASMKIGEIDKFLTPERKEQILDSLMPNFNNSKDRKRDEWCEVWIVNDSKNVYRGCSYQEKYVCNSATCK
ncbi:MAG: hypothetical protein GX447_02825 [Elusimicrobia bacterium]|nr:hypothetical protein [Elusimicrobiota bacterium]